MMYRKLNLKQVRELAAEICKNRRKYGRIIGLVGPLGAGKTAFTKALAQALGIRQAKSPTFVIVNRYDGPKNSLFHVDLYRLDQDHELRAVGLDEILDDPDAMTVIEWVDKFPGLMRRCDTILKFEILPNNLRNVTVTSN